MKQGKKNNRVFSIVDMGNLNFDIKNVFNHFFVCLSYIVFKENVEKHSRRTKKRSAILKLISCRGFSSSLICIRNLDGI